MSERDFKPDQSLWDAWQAPPSFLDAPALDGIVVVDVQPQPELPALYGSLGVLLSSGVVGFIAWRELRRTLRSVRELEVVEPYVAEAAPALERTRSGIEAKQDVEAHTKKARVG